MFTIYAVLALVCGIVLLTLTWGALNDKSLPSNPIMTVLNGVCFVGGFLLVMAAADWFNLIPEF